MLEPRWILGSAALYMAVIYWAGRLGESRSLTGRRLAEHPWVWALALGVYCTTWTYYGSFGMASRDGVAFLAVYVGPILGMLVGLPLWQRMIRLKNRHHTTSLADLLAARYGQSRALAALVTALLCAGVVPYVALQLKAVTSSYGLLRGGDSVLAVESTWISLAVALTMAGFTILFGLRRLDPTERHPGLVTSLALESVVKLVVVLVAGATITAAAFGDGSLLLAARRAPLELVGAMGGASAGQVLDWLTILLLSAVAFALLPRQHHVGVVENAGPRQLRAALWIVPVYLLLITLFVLPVALAGQAQGIGAARSDGTLLLVPLAQGRVWMALAIFLGGLSAAAGMIVLEAVALSTMIVNHLFLPVIERFHALGGLRRRLLACRWVAAALFLLLGWAFEVTAGHTAMLVSMGILSFAAVAQFLPAILGGLLWRDGSRAGAFLGIGTGFLVWTWALLTPALVRSGWFSTGLLEHGPLGVGWLRPEALFGLEGLPALPHGVAWALLLNAGAYLLGSLLLPDSERERERAADLVGDRMLATVSEDGPADILLADKLAALDGLLLRYHPPADTRRILDSALSDTSLDGRERVSVVELLELQEAVEIRLAGAIGSAAAHSAMQRVVGMEPRERRALTEVFSRVLADLQIRPRDLRRRIDYYMERESLLVRQAEELGQQVEQRTSELSETNSRLEAEVAEKERAQQALLSAQQELLASARQAGRAEIATNVLHNVGNVLNSVTVGAGEIRDRLARLQLAGVARAGQLLADQAGPGSPLAADERLRQLPAYFSRLHEVLEGERTRLLSESEQLQARVDHIRVIVNSQQGDARSKERPEPVSVGSLLDESLRQTESEVRTSGVTVIRREEEMPELTLLRHKTTQILVNLVRNAVQAMLAPGAAGRTLVVRTALLDPLRLRVELQDEGCGIAETDLVRVFQHGYTTKLDGHGFGLHASALAAQEMNGSLTASSPGPGRGSTFRLEIPIDEAKRT